MTASPATSIHAQAGPHSAAASNSDTISRDDFTPLFSWFIKKVLSGDGEFKRYGVHNSLTRAAGLVDYAFATEADPHSPDEMFERLRWGGQFVFISRNAGMVADQFKQFERFGAYIMEVPPTTLRKGILPFPGFSKRYRYFVARKILLVRPGQSTDRFSYHVELMRNPADGQYIVKKQVPSMERVAARLRDKFPNEPVEVIQRRAKKFTDKIFPVFLTREAAILQILQRDLPKAYRDRVPKVIAVEHDQHKYVRTLYLKWLRNAGEPLSQLQFAQQSAELLSQVHDVAKVIHLDLRLDNFVITEKGVGFVDFGSAVRVGEEFPESSLLNTLFDEMMRTSQIQRMLTRMMDRGLVTSREIEACHHRVDKAVDFFYLAVQISSPHGNPDLKGLIDYDPDSAQAKALQKLTNAILRPEDPENSPYKSANDIRRGLEAVERELAKIKTSKAA